MVIKKYSYELTATTFPTILERVHILAETWQGSEKKLDILFDYEHNIKSFDIRYLYMVRQIDGIRY